MMTGIEQLLGHRLPTCVDGYSTILNQPVHITGFTRQLVKENLAAGRLHIV